MAAVHPSIVYVKERARFLRRLSRTELRIAVNNDLDAIGIVSSTRMILTLVGNDLRLGWTTTDTKLSKSVEKAEDRWILDEYFRELQATKGIKHIYLHKDFGEYYSYPSSSTRLQCDSKYTTQNLPALSCTPAATTITIKKPQRFRELSNAGVYNYEDDKETNQLPLVHVLPVSGVWDLHWRWECEGYEGDHSDG